MKSPTTPQKAVTPTPHVSVGPPPGTGPYSDSENESYWYSVNEMNFLVNMLKKEKWKMKEAS